MVDIVDPGEGILIDSSQLIRPAPRGVPLRKVVYDMLDGDELSADGEGFDEVSMSVSLVFDNAEPFTVSWRVWQPYECLTTLEMWQGSEKDPLTRVWQKMVADWAVVPAQAGETYILRKSSDVSSRWSHLLGARVIGQYVAMGETGWGDHQPWSCRLEFDNGQSLVVCLGEMVGGMPSYLPDSLLVTGSREVAMSYCPHGADSSAWAEDAQCQQSNEAKRR